MLRGASLERVNSRRIVVIETQLDRPFGTTEKQALKVAVERYGDFLEVPAPCGDAAETWA